jgi:HD-GYP domain-containing protein (c-di-GMP phosphodiesterase class II)
MLVMITQPPVNKLPAADLRLQAMFQAFDDLLFVLEEDGTIVDFKAGQGAPYYMPPAKYLGRKIQEALPYKAGRKFGDALFRMRADRRVHVLEYSLLTPTGEFWYESRLVPVYDNQIIVFVRDITPYKRSEIRTRNQLEQLAALREIDLAITTGTDLSQTLGIILDHVRTRLKIDAAAILLINPHSQRLEFAADAGFITPALRNTQLRVGEGYAGQAIATRRTVHVPNLKTRKTDMLRSPFFHRENFAEYYSVPLAVKGQVLGVLEIFHRAPIQSDPDWVSFMEMLAGQAAIAIDNAALLKDLEATNAELSAAYEKTIEGWAHALHLRDRETEIHTRRVTELTVSLARKVGIAEAGMVHLRRGAILHDIGKVAIPDSILLKPGPLDSGEWGQMRRHPSIAIEMLKPIAYLEPALPIPASHHEKWDGSGYPDGRRGEDIPIEARVFAFADVYDALTSDRPYRGAWSKAEAIDYIRAQDGIQFDPHITPAFMELVGNGHRM